MTTALDLVTQAMKSIGVLEQGETPSGAEGVDGLAALNQMLSSWIHDGIDLEYENVALSDTMTYADDHMGPFRYNLAVRLAPEFGVMPSPLVMGMANDGYLQLQREYLDPDTLEIDEMLQVTSNPNELVRFRYIL